MNATLSQRRYRLGAHMFTRTARSFLWWLIPGAALTFGISVVFADELEIGAWTITASVFQWFVAVSAGIVIHQIMPALVATGLTRREVTAGLGVFGALLCAASVLFVAAGLFAEHALLAAVAEPPATLGETAGQAARYLLVTPLYCATGLLIGASEVRMRWRGYQLPVVFATAILLGGACMWLEYAQPWTLVSTVAGLALFAGTATAFALCMLGAPIHAKRA